MNTEEITERDIQVSMIGIGADSHIIAAVRSMAIAKHVESHGIQVALVDSELKNPMEKLYTTSNGIVDILMNKEDILEKDNPSGNSRFIKGDFRRDRNANN